MIQLGSLGEPYKELIGAHLRSPISFHSGIGAEPQPKSNLVHFNIKICNLVAAMSLKFGQPCASYYY